MKEDLIVACNDIVSSYGSPFPYVWFSIRLSDKPCSLHTLSIYEHYKYQYAKITFANIAKITSGYVMIMTKDIVIGMNNT